MIDTGLAYPWPTEVAAAVARFKQGDLVERPPFFYVGVARFGIWSLIRTRGDVSAETELIELDPTDGEPPYGLITTQTCDLDEQLSKPRQPWVQIAPAYRWDKLGDDQRKQVGRHEIGHLVKLTGPSLGVGFWVADLRIEVPVEKSWLVGRDPIEGFADEADYLRLAQRLAGRRVRPALDNLISTQIVTPLRQAFQKVSATKKSSLLEPVEELRLFVTGARLQATAAQILILTTVEPAPQHVVDWFDKWWSSVQTSTEAAGLALLGNRYTTLEKLAAREYVDSVPLDFRYLSPED